MRTIIAKAGYVLFYKLVSSIPNMKKPPALLVTLDATRKDDALQQRGARKLLATKICPMLEVEAQEVTWQSPSASHKCPVQLEENIETATFTQLAAQERHYHKLGAEFYLVLEGSMSIEVEGQIYNLSAGDMIIINPGAVHQVKPDGCEFICRVITANCGGAADKYSC